MNIDINKIINEFVFYLKKEKYVTDTKQLLLILNKLCSLNIERVYNLPGDAVVNGDNLFICYENILKNMQLKGNYYLDEVLFHEFSHVINSFHNSIYGEDSFIIKDYIESKMDSFTNGDLLIMEDPLLYNQDPYLGIVLLDEFIAQMIAQKLVLSKYNDINIYEKANYVNGNYIDDYEYRFYTTDICNPPKEILTELADYEEFYPYAKNFINKYGYNHEEFIKKSLNKKFIKDFIDSIPSEKINDFYQELCYLGVIKCRSYIVRGFETENDKNDPANNPKKVYEVMNKLENLSRTRK